MSKADNKPCQKTQAKDRRGLEEQDKQMCYGKFDNKCNTEGHFIFDP
jgi:hypothetical protein